MNSHLLPELLMDSIECILDGDAFEVSCGYFQPQREVQVNLLDWGCCEHFLENILVFYC